MGRKSPKYAWNPKRGLACLAVGLVMWLAQPGDARAFDFCFNLFSGPGFDFRIGLFPGAGFNGYSYGPPRPWQRIPPYMFRRPMPWPPFLRPVAFMPYR